MEQSEKEIAEYIDQRRWLLNNGLFDDSIKNQLFMYGSLVHKDVQAVELAVNAADKKVSYKVFVPSKIIKRIEDYKKLSISTSLWDMWRFRRMLKSGENLNFEHMLKRFVADFCGPNWTAEVEVLDIVHYVEKFNNRGGSEVDPPDNKQSH